MFMHDTALMWVFDHWIPYLILEAHLARFSGAVKKSSVCLILSSTLPVRSLKPPKCVICENHLRVYILQLDFL